LFLFLFSLSPTIPKFSQNKKKEEKKYRQKLPFPDRGFRGRLSRGGLTVFPVLICLEGNVGESNQNKNSKIKIKQKLTRRLESNEK
jgi:hypothetical protein